MPHGLATAASQAEMLKDRGNIYFKKERLGAAIEAYTEAITLCPRVPVYWTNRALCHRKRNDWKRVESDCRKALELDKDSVKAHYMLGLALLQSQLYGEAVRQLEKALDLGRGGKPGNYMVEEIWQELAKARFTEWEQGASYRKQQRQELREICESLLEEDYLSRMNEACSRTATSRCVEIDGVIHLDDDDSDSGSTEVREKEAVEDPRMSTKIITEQYSRRLKTLDEVFSKVGAPDSPAEVPDHLQCKITMDIFRDPVITPSGVTYERAVLLEHLRKVTHCDGDAADSFVSSFHRIHGRMSYDYRGVCHCGSILPTKQVGNVQVGKFDPLTRAPLQPEQVVPNLAIKEAVQCYLLDHGWAYRMF